ncbi:methionine synthase [Rhodococcus sp. BP-252]|uniref:methionine synthase n=1 Tax=unclassified Rhodococcus (in: high G+C Gram-positive bacteria) TaxID=192944 RepID=UPI001C9BAD7C|nr:MULTISPECIES: methionine synthase [unclassified Rhodococcus (in: high G+C Gram-positive bacteria)]MBY6410057.1 methionine synthase [Rhodococcus sp. BP-320]MBY6415026.1 methionine synthase [Rhodococcus sp. BP-321]MBY6421271.1 methionine synthase [Rhodococcus sp. BP-324]MBY6425666.1 methionine synthase [Rhodococcus sp. BP-323]MBY6429922.1 methionine synthase [Rhodococcus sp. BP-322]
MPALHRTGLLDAIRSRVVIGDGAMGTMLQDANLTLDDFLGLEGCNEILNETRPDVLREIHRAYFAAGADAVETNTFGCNLPNLADYDIADRIRDLAEKGTRLARETADEMGKGRDGMDRFVLGSMGPGTKLPTLGHAPFASLRDAYTEAALGMIDGGADAILVETCQDLLQVKAAIIGSQNAMDKLGVRIPIITHVTVETTGAMLVGSEIGAALTALEPLGIDMIGLNCATGPAEMSEHLRHLSKHSTLPVSVMPNAGLPTLGANGAEYPLTAPELATALGSFVSEYGLSLVGGCCGTTPEHIRQVADLVHGVTKADRVPAPEPGVSSLYTAVPFEQDASILMIGERTNSNGSKAFREAMIAEDYEKCLDIAKDQTRDGAHMLDLNVDYVGRDGAADMAALASRLATASTLPIMLDSTEPAVLQAGLEHLGGRSAVNSVNYEDGDGPDSRFHKIMTLVKEHGAAVVALTIDEEGQARTAEWKVRVADRLIEDITTNWGLSHEDIIVDTLTFPISTGQEEVRRDGIETIEAIRQLKAKYPNVHTTLGLSNISFGLNPAARQVLNSVFLHECTEAGLDTAIVHASKILPMNKIPDEQRETALDLVYDRRTDDYDPLQKLMQLFEGVSAASARESRAEELARLPLFERLERRIVDGERNGLDADLDAAMTEKPPLEIINETLLSGMKTVGELFGSGQMQLPFVLASAEVMKAAVAYLEPHMEATDDDGKGRIVLGTVKGDVHDIGKNLVDIILSNNGYEVVNLGIKQPISTILEAALDKRADVIGMSGLLVKSTVVMKDNLIELNNKGVAEKFPVLLGGAALTRSYVENDLQDVYEGEVHYARDAFEGLRLMDTIMTTKRGGGPAPDSPEALEAKAKAEERKARHERSRRIAEQRKAAETPVVVPDRSDVAADIEVPVPPFWGTRIVKGVSLTEYAGLLDERALFLGQWGLRGARKGEGATYEDLVESEGKPRLRYWLDRLSTDGILAHAALVYGYFPAVSEGDDVVVLTEPEPDAPERFRFSFPRQQRDRFLCVADFVRSRESARERGQVDVLPMNLVTMGQPIADFANQLFASDSYRDYLEVHGIGVQLTEALAEYWHRRVREELKLAGGTSVAADDPTNPEGFFKLEYRGARYSFGYGACPDLEDRIKLAALLEPERIGVKLSEELQLHPEQSTDAFVLHHPEAKYFNV